MRLAAAPLTLIACLLLCQQAHADSSDPWFGPDKALHFGFSAGLASVGYAGAALLLEPSWQRASLAAAFALGLGAAKELYDATGHGDPSWRDFTWDAIGCAVGIAISYAVDVLFRANANSSVTNQRAARETLLRIAW